MVQYKSSYLIHHAVMENEEMAWNHCLKMSISLPLSYNAIYFLVQT
jgi:hypothetical protein